MTVERPTQDLPLHGVGVLELVHQDHPEARTQSYAGRLAALRVGQHVAQQDEQIVEVTDTAGPLAPLQFLAGSPRQPDPLAGGARRVGVVGFQSSRPVADRRPGDLVGVGQRERRRVSTLGGVLAQVEVVDDLAAQVVDPLDHGDPGVGVAGHAETVEHLLAEAVGRRDRGPVELRGGPGQALPTQGDLVEVSPQQVPDQGVVGFAAPVATPRGGPVATPRGGLVQGAGGAVDALPHTLAQLLGRGPAERGEHQLGQLSHPFCDVAGGESRDRVRLPGASAGLEHRRAGGQRAVQVEAHEVVSASSSGSHSQRASAPKRVASGPPAGDASSASKDGGSPRT